MGGAYENESIFVYGYAGGILLMWMWAKREGQPPGNIRYRKRIIYKYAGGLLTA